jgi:hypothetical protein
MTIGFRRAAAWLGGFLFLAATAPAIAEDELGPSPKRVELEVRFLEVGKNALDGLGVDFGTKTLPPQAAEGLKAESTTQVLGETRTTTDSGQPGQVSAGSQTAPTPYHVDLEITPQITPDGKIQLGVKPSATQIDTGVSPPRVTQREAGAQTIQLESGQSAAIGGLLQPDAKELPSKVPGLRDIPILGELFRSQRFQQGDSKLMILITPSIVGDFPGGGAPVSPTASGGGAGSPAPTSPAPTQVMLPSPTLAIGGGLLAQNLPSGSGYLGVTDVGGEERFFLRFPTSVTGWSVGAWNMNWNLGPTLAGIETHVFLRGFYGSGDDEATESVAPEPGVSNGIAPWDASVSNGIASTGGGLDGEMEYEFNTFQVRGRVLGDVSDEVDDWLGCDEEDEEEYGDEDWYPDEDGPRWVTGEGGKRIDRAVLRRELRRASTFVEVTGRMGYVSQEGRQSADLFNPSPGFALFDVGSVNHIDVDEWSGILGFGLVRVQPVPWVKGLALHVGTEVGIGYRSSSADGTQANRCDIRFAGDPTTNVCAPEIQDYLLEADLDESGFDWDLGASARLYYQIPMLKGLFVAAGYDFGYIGVSRVAAGVDLTIDGPLHLERTHQAQHNLSLNIGYNF